MILKDNDLEFLRTLSERAKGYLNVDATIRFRQHVTPELVLALLEKVKAPE